LLLAEGRAIVLANGELGDVAAVRARLAHRPSDVVIAADGGARHAPALGLTVDRLLGDLDSLPDHLHDDLRRRGVVILQRPTGKDETDLELALLDARQLDASEVIVLGAAGGRLDMTLANVGLLIHPALQDLSIQLWMGADTVYRLIPPGGAILGDVGDRVSLVPFGGEVRGITTHGLAFPLHGETLPVGPARGVSNRVTLPGARVEFDSGRLLVFHTPASALAREASS
jgi:thiamine pyrophosphokinase